MTLMQSPFANHNQPYTKAYTVDDAAWLAQVNCPPNEAWDHAVYMPDQFNGSWCTGLRVSQGGVVRMQLNGMAGEDSVLMPLTPGSTFVANIKYLIPCDSTATGIIALA